MCIYFLSFGNVSLKIVFQIVRLEFCDKWMTFYICKNGLLILQMIFNNYKQNQLEMITEKFVKTMLKFLLKKAADLFHYFALKKYFHFINDFTQLHRKNVSNLHISKIKLRWKIFQIHFINDLIPLQQGRKWRGVRRGKLPLPHQIWQNRRCCATLLLALLKVS